VPNGGWEFNSPNLAAWHPYQVSYDGAVNSLACSAVVELCDAPNGDWRVETAEATL